jgi:hypothetical protein
MYKKILIANNGSDGAFKALIEGLRLARAFGSEAHMIYVEEGIAWNQHDTNAEKQTVDRKFSEQSSRISSGREAASIYSLSDSRVIRRSITGCLARPPTACLNSPHAPS